ncbi:hypothetical protein ACFSKL_16150 [Belliella marina]|uniref:Uncharacterized protein n=1 Tax=Belliella marina TaxID=1644146 RepID=A0ABW4VQ34_9BACT
MNNFTRGITFRLGFVLTLIMFPFLCYSQNQPNIPKPRGPIDFSQTSNLVIFLLIPAVIIIAYLIFRNRIKHVKEEKRKREEKEE